MYSSYYYNVELSRLQDVWGQCIEAKSRFAFYKYLEEVYHLYADLRANDAVQWGVKEIVLQFDKKPNYQNHLFRLILDATCNADRKTKSRWPRALRYAWRRRRDWKNLGAFFRKNGGPAGCALQFTQIKPKRHRHFYYKGPAARPIPAVKLKILQQRMLAARRTVNSTAFSKEWAF